MGKDNEGTQAALAIAFSHRENLLTIHIKIGVTGAGALFFSKSPAPTQTIAAQIPVAEKPTDIDTPVPPTETNVPPIDTMVHTKTKTPVPTATNTQLPTTTVLSCQPPVDDYIGPVTIPWSP